MMNLPLWEYEMLHVVRLEPDVCLKDHLNKLGADGWQPQGVIQTMPDGDGPVIILARPCGMVQMQFAAPAIVPAGLHSIGKPRN